MPTPGLVQVYTGNGKGKSTAAFGIALRAIGAGYQVEIIQWMKQGLDYGEIKAFARLGSQVAIHSYGRPGFIGRSGPCAEDYLLASQAFEHARQLVDAGSIDLLILDELNVALDYQLVELEAVLQLLKDKPEPMEIILTGRNAPAPVLAHAHLVTEMCELKHPYQQGIMARRGIEF